MKLRNSLLAATVLAAPFALTHAAKAQPVSGIYVAGGIGYNIEQSSKVKDVIVDNDYTGDTARISLHNGYTGEASIGYGFGNGWRVEIEGDYFENRFDKIKFDGGDYGLSGKEQKYGAFVNGLYDFDNAFGGAVTGSQSRGALAYQGIAGVAFPIAPIPGLSATVEYRFTALAGSRKYSTGFEGVSATAKVLHEYNDSIQAGLRYAFNTAAPVAPAPAPAPAPVAAPAPAPSRTYLVFFDWDRSDLTPRATQIIAQAASDSKTNSVTTIDVSGYTDTSGTPDYNQGLSERRASAVAAQLVTDGVPQSEIETHAYGETHLLVPTGPGVREPQNRRVEIVLD
jgi:outer membrane protein OmpA-like peptidoglycan-associated protein